MVILKRALHGKRILAGDGTLTIPLAGGLRKLHGLVTISLSVEAMPLTGVVSYLSYPMPRREPLNLDESSPGAFPNNMLWLSSRARRLVVTLPNAIDPGTEVDYRLERVNPEAAAAAMALEAPSRRARHRALRRYFKTRSLATENLSSMLHPTEGERQRLRQSLLDWPDRPLISVVTPCWNSDPGFLSAAVASVRDQNYDRWEMILVDDGSTDPDSVAAIRAEAACDRRITLVTLGGNRGIAAATNAGLAECRGDFVAFLDHDDVLDPAALLVVADALRRHPRIDMVYTDEDIIGADGEVLATNLKPDFDEFLLLAVNYICHLTVIRRSVLEAIGGLRHGYEVSQDHELVLRMARRLDSAAILHIPKVLYHWRQFPDHGSVSKRQPETAIVSRQRAARDHLEARGWSGTVSTDALGFNHIALSARTGASVTAIIPTRDRASLLRACVDSVRRTTRQDRLDLLIVDNGSREQGTSDLLRRYRREGMRVIRDDGPFNFSRLCNTAVDACASDYVLLLNNDIEAIEDGWLSQLLSFAALDDAGAVGCKLVYADGTLQHVGVTVDQGRAGHPFRGMAADFGGFHQRAHLTRQVSAVTGACLLVARSKYLEVGGMDARNLPIIYNDIDFCLKLQKQGYRNIYVADVRLVHHESASRGETDFRRHRLEVDTMKARWGAATRRDPFFRHEIL
ncbi:MAG: glycosyltransferase [Azospirillaceae bacterium]